MSELILKFNIPEEKEEANIAVSASSMYSAVWNFKQELRKKLKYGEYSDKERILLEEINELLIKELDENNVLKLF